MITIDAGRCTGCAACVEVCPSSALYLVDGTATVDKALCHECEACLAVCPTGAIARSTLEEPVVEAVRLPAHQPMPEVIPVQTSQAPVPLRSRLLPTAGAALAWAGREVLPWLMDWLDALDRRTAQPHSRGTARSRKNLAPDATGGGRQHRHRRRGGG